jgi:hypothetical protein
MYVWPLMKVHEHMQRGESCCSFLVMLVCKGLCMCHACVCCCCPNDDITLQLDTSCEQVFRRGLCRRPHRPGGLGQVVLQDASSGCLIACEATCCKWVCVGLVCVCMCFLFVCMYVWPLMKVHEHMQRGESCCSLFVMLVCKGLCMCHVCVCCFCPNDDITLQLDNSCEQVFRRGVFAYACFQCACICGPKRHT